jgi:hypothetical protein
MRRHRISRKLVGLALAGGLGVTPLASPGDGGQTPAGDQGPVVPGDAQVLAAFQKRVEAYLEIRNKAEAGLPGLPEAATPQQIHAHQVSLEGNIRAARPGSSRGDIFGREMEQLIRRRMAAVFASDRPAELRASILDENPVGIKFNLDHRYPDEVPMSTMPPQVLKALPPLPEGLEYRFIGPNLILLDVQSHTIADFVPDVLPAGEA